MSSTAKQFIRLYVDDMPSELGDLKKLAQIIIAEHIVFEKITVMPKGQHGEIKGVICTVPVQCDQICIVI